MIANRNSSIFFSFCCFFFFNLTWRSRNLHFLMCTTNQREERTNALEKKPRQLHRKEKKKVFFFRKTSVISIWNYENTTKQWRTVYVARYSFSPVGTSLSTYVCISLYVYERGKGGQGWRRCLCVGRLYTLIITICVFWSGAKYTRTQDGDTAASVVLCELRIKIG